MNKNSLVKIIIYSFSFIAIFSGFSVSHAAETKSYTSVREQIVARVQTKTAINRFSIDTKKKLIYGVGLYVTVFDYKLKKISQFRNVFSKWAYGFALSQDGKKLAIGNSDGVITLISTTTGGKIKEYNGHTRDVSHLIFEGGDKYLISSADDQTTRVWNLETDDEQFRIRKGGYGSGYLGNFKWLNVGLDRKVKDNFTIYDLQKEKIDKRLQDCEKAGRRSCAIGATDIRGIQAHPDKKTFLTFGEKHGATKFDDQSQVAAWSLKSGKRRTKFETEHNVGSQGVHDISSDGRLIAAGGGLRGAEIYIWDFPSGKLLVKFTAHSDNLTDIKFIPNTNLLVSSGRNEEVIIWKIKTK